MDGVDALLLARIQFAANMTFHILFPTISISLAWVLLFFKLRYVRTKNEYWMDAYQFWVKIFALTFALGVVSGITMSFQFGTNWPGFMETVGNIAGPLLAYEVLTAGASASANAYTRWRRFWWPSAPACQRSGFWRSTRGCIRQPATR
jgi:cytochrome bd ubiquinol oxidase subunit I